MEVPESGEIKDHLILNERFARTEEKFPHGRLLVRDVVPENPRDEVPLISTLGFGTGNVALERTVAELYYAGEHVVEIDFLGGGKGIKGEKGSSSEYNRQGVLLAEFMDKYFEDNPHIRQMDIMAQSAAIFRLFSLAKLRPDLLPKIRNVILTAPVGLGDKESVLELYKRSKREESRYKNAERGHYDSDNDANLKKAFNQTVLPYPLTALKHIKAIADGEQYDGLDVLKNAGVKVGIIQGDEDLMADANELWERIGRGYEKPFKQGINPLTDETMNIYDPVEQEEPPFQIIRMVKGGHGVQVDDPKKSSRMILQTIDYLNAAE